MGTGNRKNPKKLCIFSLAEILVMVEIINTTYEYEDKS